MDDGVAGFRALGADVVLVDGPVPPWGRRPCFHTGYELDGLTVLVGIMTATPSRMRYRREVDGLRALAVVPVILFHAGFQAFSGGFVGVDVFFVISGYLITSMILAEKQSGTFSLVKFYERRARRILPALFVVLLACSVLAWLWLLPDDMKSYSDSLMAVNAFVSNIFFFRDTSYFAPDAELRPLLHTWSLAVEEQYYVIYPLLLLTLWRFGRRGIAWTLALVAATSLALAQWGSITHPRYTFFMLHTRAWELLVGAFVAFALFSRDHDRSDVDRATSGPVSQASAILGFLLIVYAACYFDARTPSPSLYTVIPVLGAALIIVFARPQTLVGALLGSRLFVGVGLISYSAYLWHQPLFAFAKYRSAGDPGKPLLLVLAAVALVLAYVSWKYVETPFRNRQRFTRTQIFSYGASCGALFLAFGLLGHSTDGFYGRFSDEQVQVLQYSHYDHQNVYRSGICFLDDNQTLPFSNLCQVSNGAQATLIWGDSHAAALSAGLRRALPDVIQYTASRCLPLKDEVITDRPDCKGINDFVMREIERTKPRQIFLHADWRRHRDQGPAKNIRRTIDFIQAVSPATRITIVGGVPQWHPSLPIMLFRQNISMEPGRYLRSSVFSEIAEIDKGLEATAKESGVRFFSALRALCRGEECQPVTMFDGCPDTHGLGLRAFDGGRLGPPGGKTAREAIGCCEPETCHQETRGAPRCRRSDLGPARQFRDSIRPLCRIRASKP